MKKTILLLIFISLTAGLLAKEIEAKYNITYGNFLDLGLATSTLEIINDNYKIKIEAKTTGMAKFLTNNRVEIYESHGKIINNLFVPNKFIKTKKDDNKKRVRTYAFDYKNEKIFINDKRSGKKIKYNTNFEKEFEVLNSNQDSILDYFAKNDILSLFFNLKNKMKTFENGKEYSLKAVGANKTKGFINILMPTNNSLKLLNKALKTNDKSKFTVFINQKIFQSEKGELLISLNKEGFCSYAILKNVLLFGDIVGEMIDFKIKEESKL